MFTYVQNINRARRRITAKIAKLPEAIAKTLKLRRLTQINRGVRGVT